MTDQAADIIFIDGSSHTMLTFPLEMYREEHRPAYNVEQTQSLQGL